MKQVALWMTVLSLVLLSPAGFAQYADDGYGERLNNRNLYGTQDYDTNYREYLNEVVEARNDLATGEIDLEEYYSEIQEAEQMLYDREYDWDWGRDNYGYYYGDYQYDAADWDENWYGDADQWFDWDVGFDTDYGYGTDDEWGF